jgi:hypothetical protein
MNVCIRVAFIGLVLALASPASAQLKIHTGSASAAADAVVDRIDAGSGPGTLTIFGATCPDAANDADSGTVLAVLTFSDPAFGSASAGVATANSITADSSANATGTAACFRAKDSDANVVFQGTITTAGNGGDLILSTTSITSGQSVSITALTYTQPTLADYFFAQSCSSTHVQAAIDAASDGGTVVIPAGSCTWTTAVTIAGKALSIIGAGVDVTTITDGTPKGLAYTSSQMVTWTLEPTGAHRLAHLTIDGGTGDAEPYNTGIMRIYGENAVNFRMDHFKLITRRTAGVLLHDVLGVIDHGEFILSNSGVPGPNKFAIYIFHHEWGGVGGYGDNSWAQATGFGTNQFLFVEDCTFTSDPASANGNTHSYAVDGWAGQRVVYRNNTFTNATWANHGTESGGRLRSARAAEIYDNAFVMNTSNVVVTSAIGSRGGAAVIYDNTLTMSGGAFITNFIDLAVLRANSSYYPWGKCDGTSVYDDSAAVGGLQCIDQPGVGVGDLLSGDPASPADWPNHASDPNYIWGNLRNGVSSDDDNGVSRNSQIQLSRDFYRTSKPGYTPYTYPHPLRY